MVFRMEFTPDQISTRLRPLAGCRQCVVVDVELPGGRRGGVLVTTAALVAADLWTGAAHARARAIARSLNALARRRPPEAVVDGLTREPERDRTLLRAVG
jgi:hypothetical protein